MQSKQGDVGGDASPSYIDFNTRENLGDGIVLAGLFKKYVFFFFFFTFLLPQVQIFGSFHPKQLRGTAYSVTKRVFLDLILWE